MSRRNPIEKIQNNPNVKTEYVTREVQYAPTVFLPTKVITSYSKPTTYGYPSTEQYNYTQTKTTTITTTNTTTNTQTYNYPHTIYYSNGNYIQTDNNNYSNAFLQGQTYQNIEGRKTVQNYEYQHGSDKKPQITKTDQAGNNIIYVERKTNYPQTNNLNLNYIYNMSNNQNSNKMTNIKKTQNPNNINYEYYNNNMYMVQSGNIATAKPKAQVLSKNPIPNNYYNNYSNQQQIVNNQNNINNTYKSNTTTNIKNRINLNTQVNDVINNQANTYINNKIKINNKKANKNATFSGYSSKPNNLNTINKDIYSENNDGLIEEPPDNMRKKDKNNDRFNRTMPNLKENKELSSTLNTTDRKSYPLQSISTFEISFDNTAPQSKIKNIIPPKVVQNNPPVLSNNIPISTNQNNIQNVQIQNNNTYENLEYKDKYGNSYVLINGQIYAINSNSQKAQSQKKDINNQKNVVKNAQIDKNDARYQNKDNVYYEEIIQEPTNINNPAYFDTYTGQKINTQNDSKKNTNYSVDINKIQQEFNLQNNNQYNDYLNNTFPAQGQKVYKVEYLVNSNTIQNDNSNGRVNKFKQEQNYTNINMNPNYNYNIQLNQQQQQQIINNALYNKTKSGAIGESDLPIVVPQQPKKRRPVYKIPPSKKRAVSQGRSLTFIHKYYDENFILEEDNEDNASDSENKKQNKKLKNIFRNVTNLKRMIPQGNNIKQKDEEENDNLEENENIIINPEEDQNNLENKDNNNNENAQNNNAMRLSCIRFSLDPSSSNQDEKSKDNNKNKEIENNNNIDDNADNNKDDKNKEKESEDNDLENKDNKELNSEIIKNSHLKEMNENENILSSSLSMPKNSDSILEPKISADKINISNLEKNIDGKILRNIDINSSSNDNVSTIKESTVSSINPNFFDPKETGIEDSILNSNINIDKSKLNINIENDKKENDDDDKRISLNIGEHNLDKYFEKEGVNKRDPKQNEISTSLKTINLEENKELINSQLSKGSSGNLSRGNSKEGELLTLDDALKGSVHIPEKIQNFVNKNNELYNDNNK